MSVSTLQVSSAGRARFVFPSSQREGADERTALWNLQPNPQRNISLFCSAQQRTFVPDPTTALDGHFRPHFWPGQGPLAIVKGKPVERSAIPVLACSRQWAVGLERAGGFWKVPLTSGRISRSEHNSAEAAATDSSAHLTPHAAALDPPDSYLTSHFPAFLGQNQHLAHEKNTLSKRDSAHSLSTWCFVYFFSTFQ